jgi:hypothetical protein
LTTLPPQAATDTIAYVVTDQNGLTSTSTRTVIIQAAPSIVPADDAAQHASDRNSFVRHLMSPAATMIISAAGVAIARVLPF